MTTLLAAVLALAAAPAPLLAAAAPAGAPLISSHTLRVPLCPVAIELEPAMSRIRWVRLAFVPSGYRRPCHRKTLRECRDLMIDEKRHPRRGRSGEPEKILEIRVGQDERDLLEKLAGTRAVAELKGRKDSTWEAAGEGVEYPYDDKRTVTARVRWLVYANGEKLEVVEPLK